MNTYLYERCRECRGDESCICNGKGYISTNYTTERCDRMQTEIDRLLMLVDSMLTQMNNDGWWDPLADLVLKDKADELEAAKSWTTPYVVGKDRLGLPVLKTGKQP